jgi:DNA-binding PadR family transcriptional regulator
MKRTNMKRIMAQTSTTSLGYALLGLVHLQPQTGYDLRKVFETTPLGHYSSSPGAIYPALKRLEKKGLIRGEVAEADTMRPKRIYSSTPRGVEALRDWVSQPLTKDDFLHRDDELMLRFALMGSVVDDATTRRFLEQMLQALDAYIPELRQVLTSMPDAGPPHGRLALMSGIESYKTRRKWVRQALDEFAPDKGKRRRK